MTVQKKKAKLSGIEFSRTQIFGEVKNKKKCVQETPQTTATVFLVRPSLRLLNSEGVKKINKYKDSFGPETGDPAGVFK